MASDQPSDPYLQPRSTMVEDQLRRRHIHDERVLSAMLRVPRHEFVREDLRGQAYADHPIEIAEGQTISQPFMVAAMVEVAELRPTDVVLEVGTGSGYQAAVLAEIAAQVFTIERFPSLASSAEELLSRLGYSNVTVIQGDGTSGFAAHAPYNAIVVAAASPRVPQTLVSQLAEGGRLVIPVGDADEQELQLIKKINGEDIMQHLSKCKFVPLIGKYGFPAE